MTKIWNTIVFYLRIRSFRTKFRWSHKSTGSITTNLSLLDQVYSLKYVNLNKYPKCVHWLCEHSYLKNSVHYSRASRPVYSELTSGLWDLYIPSGANWYVISSSTPWILLLRTDIPKSNGIELSMVNTMLPNIMFIQHLFQCTMRDHKAFQECCPTILHSLSWTVWQADFHWCNESTRWAQTRLQARQKPTFVLWYVSENHHCIAWRFFLHVWILTVKIRYLDRLYCIQLYATLHVQPTASIMDRQSRSMQCVVHA